MSDTVVAAWVPLAEMMALPFRTLHDWTPLGGLRVGDRVAVPRRIPTPSTAGLGWSEERLALLAYLIADGNAPGLIRFAEIVGGWGRSGERLTVVERDARKVYPNPNVDVLPREVWDIVKADRVAAGMTERVFQAEIGTTYCGAALYKSSPSRARLEREEEIAGHDASIWPFRPPFTWPSGLALTDSGLTVFAGPTP